MDKINMQTIDIKEAAKLLGMCTANLSNRAKRGLIPGAFKAGMRWMFIVEKLVDYIEALENSQREIAQVDINRKPELCRSAKRKTVRIGIQGSQSRELECRNQLAALFDQTLNNTKANGKKKSGVKFS